MGAAVMCARAIVRDLYPPLEGARMMSKGLSGLGVIAVVCAPLGGLMVELLNWRAALAVLVLHRDKLRTEVVRRAADAPQGSDTAFLKLPVVWWCFAFFLLSTMTLAVVQNFAAPLMQAMHGVSFEAATTTITERGATRLDDQTSEASMEQRKKEGYF